MIDLDTFSVRCAVTVWGLLPVIIGAHMLAQLVGLLLAVGIWIWEPRA